MSHGTSPAHRFSGSFDTFYNPDFTAEISTKMTVPQKISLREENHTTVNQSVVPDEPEKLFMHVPERILVVGGDQHVEGREPLPEMKLESSVLGEERCNIHLNSPPHTLTLQEHHYPTLYEEGTSETEQKNQSRKIDLEPLPQKPIESSLALPFSPPPDGLIVKSTEEEVALLRNQVHHLSRRMLAVEQENQQIQHREVILYTMSALYFLLKGIMWLYRHW
ncbi:transport and Golgi organization protein 11-like [Tachypleus tridentatus]|uniref:transport and Golgi organization protein 11-like n=1 Tax=Tachypleus tridentatus TaxID=6853 RepID=UPI003FD5880C